MAKDQPKLFINYRSEDTGPTASRLFEDLVRELGPDQVFLDHAGLEGGSVWSERLQEAVMTASAMFCLIGKSWLTARDPETGDRLLNFSDDWVLTPRNRSCSGKSSNNTSTVGR